MFTQDVRKGVDDSAVGSFELHNALLSGCMRFTNFTNSHRSLFCSGVKDRNMVACDENPRRDFEKGAALIFVHPLQAVHAISMLL